MMLEGVAQNDQVVIKSTSSVSEKLKCCVLAFRSKGGERMSSSDCTQWLGRGSKGSQGEDLGAGGQLLPPRTGGGCLVAVVPAGQPVPPGSSPGHICRLEGHFSLLPFFFN